MTKHKLDEARRPRGLCARAVTPGLVELCAYDVLEGLDGDELTGADVLTRRAEHTAVMWPFDIINDDGYQRIGAASEPVYKH